jgi:hypothetical protein
MELFGFYHSVAQFYDASNWLNIQQGGTEGMYGNGISLYDFNLDGYDDITICTNGNGVRTYVNSYGSFTELNLFNSIPGDIKQPIWVDFDNDHDPDFFCTVYSGGCFLFRNEGNLLFTDVTSSLNLPSANAKCFGAAWADFDLDGDLDVYVANYDFILPGALSNWFFVNQGNGSFIESAGILGIGNGYRASFQPAWCDVNLDGWPDLFVVNDKYHGNALYLNNAGVFSDVSESYNMSHAMESMSNSWNDFDADGDFDVYVSNSTQGNKLLRNNGFFFSDIAPDTDTEVNSVCWNALWFDADHDLNIDLHVATNSPFFESNQNKLFEFTETGNWNDLSIPGDQRSVLSEVKGDLNNDGFWDMVQVAEFPVSTACWLNSGNSNHYLKFTLTGTVSNRDGIGALVKANIGGEHYVKTLFAGAGFISQDSKHEIFSLKSQTSVDTLEVHWPSGWVDVYTNLAADATYEFTEGETFRVVLSTYQANICSGDSTVIHASAHGNVIWQDNTTSTELMADAPGWYVCTAFHELGFAHTDSIYIGQWNTPEHEVFVQLPLCYDEAGASAQIISQSATIIFINGVESEFVLDSLSSGNYQCLILDENGCEAQFEFDIDMHEPLQSDFISDTICFETEAQIYPIISGGVYPYEINWYDIDPMHVPAGVYIATVIDAVGCAGEFQFEVNQYDSLSAQIVYSQELNSLYAVASGGLAPYQYQWMNGESYPEILVGSEQFYTCTITDAANCSVETSIVISSIPFDNKSGFILYPIPASNVLYVISDSKWMGEIYHTSGTFIRNVDIYPGKNELNLEDLIPGSYFLSSSHGSRLFIIKE